MPTQNALRDQAARFAADVAALTGPQAGDRFGLAISGGADSVAMLLLAHAAFPGRIAAATVDHKLRAESGDEARFVAALCAERGIAHAILPLEGLLRGNVSAAARDGRYAALDGWAAAQGLDWLLTGHHADDQAETLMMRLNRGSGVAGLAGVRRRRGRIIRPLLGWRRAELAAVVAAQGIAAVDDPSNRDDRYDRARLRKALGEAPWFDPVAAAKSAAALADADDALDWVVIDLRSSRLSHDGAVWRYHAAGLPRELCRRALIDCLRMVDPDCDPRGDAIVRVLNALAAAQTVTIGRVRCSAPGDGTTWQFTPAPLRRATR